MVNDVGCFSLRAMFFLRCLLIFQMKYFYSHVLFDHFFSLSPEVSTDAVCFVRGHGPSSCAASTGTQAGGFSDAGCLFW